MYRSYMRLAIMLRDGTECWLCHRMDMIEPDEGTNWSIYDERMMTFDHVIPKSMGGWDDYSNLKIACAKCNSRRGDKIDFLPKKIRRRAERAAKRKKKRKAAKQSQVLVQVLEK